MMSNNMKQYAQYLWRSNRYLIAIVWLTLFAVIPFAIAILSDGDVHAMQFVSKLVILFGWMFSFLLPIYLFRFIFQKRSVDLYFSLPIKKTQLFLTTYFMGLFMVLIPVFVDLLVFGTSLNQSISFTYHINFIVVNCILIFTLYSLVTWVIQHCNNLLDGVLGSGAYLFVPLILLVALYAFMGNQYSNIMVGSGNYVSEIPFLKIVPNLVSLAFYMGYQLGVNGIWYILIFWLCIGILCTYAANRAFVKRQQEDSEQRTTVWWIYPLIIGILTFCLILIIANVNMRPGPMLISTVVIFMIYLCMVFFSQRKIKISPRSVILFIGCYALCFIFSFSFQKTQGFHLVQEVPSISNISSVNFDFHYFGESGEETQHFLKVQYEDAKKKQKEVELSDMDINSKIKKDIEQLVGIQSKLIPAQKHIEATNKGYDGNVDIQYILKNGTAVQRSYTVDTNTIQTEMEMVLNSNADGSTSYELKLSQKGDDGNPK